MVIMKSEPPPIVTMAPLFVNEEDAARLTSLSTALMQKLSASGEFPAKRKLSKGRAAYLVEDLQAWARSRPASDLLPPVNSGKGRAPAQ